MIRGLSLDDPPGSLHIVMRMMRAPGNGWLMISAASIFLKKMLPDLTHAETSPEALACCCSPFPTGARRKPLRQRPSELPLDGVPADNVAVVEAYRQWLTRTDVPKCHFLWERRGRHQGSRGRAASGESLEPRQRRSRRRHPLPPRNPPQNNRHRPIQMVRRSLMPTACQALDHLEIKSSLPTTPRHRSGQDPWPAPAADGRKRPHCGPAPQYRIPTARG